MFRTAIQVQGTIIAKLVVYVVTLDERTALRTEDVNTPSIGEVLHVMVYVIFQQLVVLTVAFSEGPPPPNRESAIWQVC